MCRRKAVNDGERAVKGSAAKDVQMWLARWCIPSEHTHTHTHTHSHTCLRLPPPWKTRLARPAEWRVRVSVGYAVPAARAATFCSIASRSTPAAPC